MTAPIFCMGPAYVGCPSACHCGVGYNGTVQYTSTYAYGCVAIPCVGPAYSGPAAQCVCGSGYYGTANFTVNGTTTGCDGIPCVGPAYSGPAAQCVCGSGYYGTANFTVNGTTTGCEAIPCVAPNYTGVPGQCVCGSGYRGNVSFVANTTTGCVQEQPDNFDTSGLDDGELSAILVPILLLAFMALVGLLARCHRLSKSASAGNGEKTGEVAIEMKTMS